MDEQQPKHSLLAAVATAVRIHTQQPDLKGVEVVENPPSNTFRSFRVSLWHEGDELKFTVAYARYGVPGKYFFSWHGLYDINRPDEYDYYDIRDTDERTIAWLLSDVAKLYEIPKHPDEVKQ